jgi:hypothetical protein
MSSRKRTAVAVLAVGAIVLGGYLVRIALWRPQPLTGTAIDDGYARAAGVVHVHTTLSDGGGSPAEVIAAARRAGLDFVGISDHNNVDAIALQGYVDGVLTLAGAEITTTAGHLLALGLERDPDYRFSPDPGDAVRDVHELGGVAFAAHPYSPRADFRWSGWRVAGPWNLEIINGDSEWRRAGPWLAPTLALYQVNAPYALLRILTPPEETLARWDELLQERDVVGIYGSDAHSRVPIAAGTTLRFPSYEALFALARNHLLLDQPLSGNAAADRAAVLDALRRGRFYIGLDGLAPAGGFSFVVESPGGHRWTMGDGAPHRPDLRARAGGRIPAGASIRLLRDGAVIAESADSLDLSLPGTGVYRVEVTVAGWQAPWVITNPIAVFDRDTLAARSVAWPPDPPVFEPVAIIDDFDGETTFTAGHDEASAIDGPVLAPGEGYDDGALRLAFELAHPTPDNADVFAALVSWEHRDLRGFRGLTFRVRADGVYRMWLQVRDANPASTDDGTEWWFASVKTSTDWQQVSVPFAALRSADPNSDGQLDLDRVRALVFVIDKGAMKPGSSGTIWIDELGVY